MKRTSTLAGATLALNAGLIFSTGGAANAFGSRNVFNSGCGTTYGFASWTINGGGAAVSGKGTDGSCKGHPGVSILYSDGTRSTRVNHPYRAETSRIGARIVGGYHWRAIVDRNGWIT
ncbi:hypothetical protein [Mycetocola tolaasinivorans]|uniref:hypothetical protein n=1 Tax=Mycetocola tolaasinivorans TaxID=76635 RepID=UPI0011C3DAFF|nr:hypothetical protein [Mycetocola tolaasinivorans]